MLLSLIKHWDKQREVFVYKIHYTLNNGAAYYTPYVETTDEKQAKQFYKDVLDGYLNPTTGLYEVYIEFTDKW